MNRRVKITLTAFVLLTLAVSQPGCWDYREVERLGIVLATGVDTAPGGKVKVVVQTIVPSALVRGAGGMGMGAPGFSGVKAYRNRVVEGHTISEALRDLSRQTPRQLFFAHDQVVILSESLARQGVKEVMDYFERSIQVRRTPWLLVARADPVTLLDLPGRVEVTPASRIFNILNERNSVSRYAVQRLGDFMEMMESGSTHPFTAVIDMVPNPASPEEHTKKMPEGHVAEPRENMRINGTAVFRRDRLAGWLDSRESRGLLWVRSQVRGGVIEVPLPEEKDKKAALEILRSKTRLQPEIREGRVLMTAKIKTEANLAETTGPLDLTRPETVAGLERLLAEAVRGEVEAALAKAQQEYRVDVFGFGEAVHRKYPRQWKTMKKEWEDMFPAVQVRVQVESKIRRSGMITNPVEPGQR